MAHSWLGPTLWKTFPSSYPRLPSTSFPSSPLSSSSMASFPSHHRQCRCSSDANPSHPQPALLVFSGGTAFNGVAEELKNFTTRVAHVLPVSDDGGSTAEIVRVLGGPAVGDIRSRCLRLSNHSTAEALAVRRLLGHRLSLDPHHAKSEWYHFIDAVKSLLTAVNNIFILWQNQNGTKNISTLTILYSVGVVIQIDCTLGHIFTAPRMR